MASTIDEASLHVTYVRLCGHENEATQSTVAALAVALPVNGAAVAQTGGQKAQCSLTGEAGKGGPIFPNSCRRYGVAPAVFEVSDLVASHQIDDAMPQP